MASGWRASPIGTLGSGGLGRGDWLQGDSFGTGPLRRGSQVSCFSCVWFGNGCFPAIRDLVPERGRHPDRVRPGDRAVSRGRGGEVRPPRILCVMRKTICDSYRKNPHTLSLHWRRVRTDGGELFLFIVLSRPGRGGDELPYPKATVLNLSCACRRNASGLMPDTYSGRL